MIIDFQAILTLEAAFKAVESDGYALQYVPESLIAPVTPQTNQPQPLAG